MATYGDTRFIQNAILLFIGRVRLSKLLSYVLSNIKVISQYILFMNTLLQRLLEDGWSTVCAGDNMEGDKAK